MTRDFSRGAGMLSLYEPVECESPTSITLEIILELAEQLDPEQLHQLATRAEELRLKCCTPVATDTRSLTDREKEVLVLVASGYNRKEIGRTLAISACTAAKHISNIYSKLGISSVAEATRMALVQDVSLIS